MAIKVRKVRCPQCGGEALWSMENKYRPFCSERCKQIDLGAWASEAYRVPVQEKTLELDDDYLSKAE
ncbi:DNA gyrase inhibitor YacG [Betaproteobacteria bacterium]|nr:DNA gyrase inhibitor YacG [Betaproteobacteria bacterium]